MIYKCLTSADRGDEGCGDEERGDRKKNVEVKKKRKTMPVEMGEEQNEWLVEKCSPIIEAGTRARSENSGGEGRERHRLKKAVIGGVWCLSNTERLVMIPLALYTVREGHRNRDRERGEERERRIVTLRQKEDMEEVHTEH